MNSLKMDDVDRVMREREITRSLAPAPKLGKGRPVLRVIDNILEAKKLGRELDRMNNYD